MKTLKTLVGVGGLVCALGGWSMANAASYTFDFTGGSSTLTGTETAGNTRTFNSTSGGLSVDASGWRVKNSSPTAEYLGWYSHGLGVTNNDERWGDSHTVDNINKDDFVLFDFSQDVKLESIVLQLYGDDDITYGYGDTWNNGLVNKDDGVITGSLLSGFISTHTLSSLGNDDIWRISAQIGEDNDSFKIKSITVSSSAVPLPTAVWLFGSALLGMVGIGSRRRRVA